MNTLWSSNKNTDTYSFENPEKNKKTPIETSLAKPTYSATKGKGPLSNNEIKYFNKIQESSTLYFKNSKVL